MPQSPARALERQGNMNTHVRAGIFWGRTRRSRRVSVAPSRAPFRGGKGRPVGARIILIRAIHRLLH